MTGRNVPPHVAAFLRGMRYTLEKKQGNRTDITSAHNEQKSIDTAERIAKEAGVSRATVVRDGKFADDVESLKESVPDIQERGGIWGSETFAQSPTETEWCPCVRYHRKLKWGDPPERIER